MACAQLEKLWFSSASGCVGLATYQQLLSLYPHLGNLQAPKYSISVDCVSAKAAQPLLQTVPPDAAAAASQQVGTLHPVDWSISNTFTDAFSSPCFITSTGMAGWQLIWAGRAAQQGPDSSGQETALQSILQWAGTSVQRLSSRLLAGAGTSREGQPAVGGNASALLQVTSAMV